MLVCPRTLQLLDLFPPFPKTYFSLTVIGGSVVKNPPANAGDTVLIPRSGRSLEEEIGTHSSILAWEMQCTEKPGGVQSTE